jgi:hypothetical protein
LALWALWLRRSLRMPVAEATQLVLGFSIPFFLVDHVLLTRVGDTFFDAHYGYYSTVLHAYVVANPPRGGLQLLVMVIASSNLGAPTSKAFDYQRFLKCSRRAADALSGTKRHRNAPSGTESPEIIPKCVLQAFTAPKQRPEVDHGPQAVQ